MRKLDRLSIGGLVCLAVLVVFALGSLVGAGGDPDAIVGPRLQPPGPGWWLGTDNLGRSVLPRVMEGVGTTLLLSSVAVLVTAALSATFGIIAGYRGGYLNELVMRLVEVLYSFPAIVLAILVAAVLGPGQTAALASIVLVTIPLMTGWCGPPPWPCRSATTSPRPSSAGPGCRACSGGTCCPTWRARSRCRARTRCRSGSRSRAG